MIHKKKCYDGVNLTCSMFKGKHYDRQLAKHGHRYGLRTGESEQAN